MGKKYLCIILILTLLLTSCLNNNNNNDINKIKLSDENRELFQEDKLIIVEELINDIVEWNDNLKKIDFSDVKSINESTLFLKDIFERYNNLMSNINNNNEKGQKQSKILSEFSKLNLDITFSYMSGHDIKGKFTNGELIKYFLDNECKSINNFYIDLFKYCSDSDDLIDNFKLNKTELSEYLACIYSNYIIMQNTPQFAKDIIIP